MNDTVTNDMAQELPVEAISDVQHFVVHVNPETGEETRIPVSVEGVTQDVDFAEQTVGPEVALN